MPGKSISFLMSKLIIKKKRLRLNVVMAIGFLMSQGRLELPTSGL